MSFSILALSLLLGRGHPPQDPPPPPRPPPQPWLRLQRCGTLGKASPRHLRRCPSRALAARGSTARYLYCCYIPQVGPQRQPLMQPLPMAPAPQRRPPRAPPRSAAPKAFSSLSAASSSSPFSSSTSSSSSLASAAKTSLRQGNEWHAHGPRHAQWHGLWDQRVFISGP